MERKRATKMPWGPDQVSRISSFEYARDANGEDRSLR